MNFKILKQDLKRKKSMNAILLIFILLATTFIAASINNIVVIMNGTDYFMDRSGVQDYIVVTMGGSREELPETNQEIENYLKEEEQVTEYGIDEILFFTNTQMRLSSGGKIKCDSSMLLSSFDISQQKFFDKENKEIKNMEDGTMYLPQKIMSENDLKEGDKLSIRTEGGYQKEFTIKGCCKDAFIGSDMMGIKRCIISRGDFEEAVLNSGLPYGRMYSVSCNDFEKFEQSYNDAGFSTVFSCGRSMIKMSYVMDMIVAAVLLLVSLCLVIISVIMLRFNIVFTVNEDYKEIGIMKAIGIPDGAIRRLYLSKYFVIALVGAAFGFVVSIPFGRMLIEQVTDKMVIEELNAGIGRTLLTSVLVVLVVLIFGYRSTGKIKSFMPMDAIRSGNNGERFQKKGKLRLADSRWRATTFLAGNDCLSEFRKYLVLLITSAVGIWLVIMPVNTINTLCSERVVKWFGVSACDFHVIDEDKLVDFSAVSRSACYDFMEEVEEKLKEEGIDVSRVVMEMVYRLKIRHGESSLNALTLQGLNTEMDEYFYDKGTPPAKKNEVAVTQVVADKIHAGIGDTVYITAGREEKPFVVTAIFQSMNNLGEAVRLPEQADFDYSAVSAAGSFGAQVRLSERPKEAEYDKLLQRVKGMFPDAKIQTSTQFIQSQIGDITEQLASLKAFILAIVIVINILVVVLMQKMFLIRERRQMGMLKAIGFSNSAIIGWQTKRIMLVLFLGILLGTVTGTPFSQFTAGQVFKMMGASKIVFDIHPLEVYVLYPVALFAATVTACVIAMLRVRNVSTQEANIEE